MKMGKNDNINFQGKVCQKIDLTGNRSVLGCDVSADDQTAVSCSSDNKISVWDIESGNLLGTLMGHQDEVTCCSLGDELLITGSKDGVVMVWKYRDLKRVSKISVHSKAVNAVTMAPNNTCLASASEDGTARIFAIRGGSGEFIQGGQSRSLEGHDGSVNDISFSTDSQAVVTCGNDGTIKIWDVVGGDCLLTLAGKGGKIFKCGFKRDGRQVVSMTRMCVSIWSISKRQVAWEIEDKDGKGFQVLACHPTASLFLLVGMDGTLCGYNMSTKSQVFQTETNHYGPVLSGKFSTNGTRLVTGGIDGKLLVWM